MKAPSRIYRYLIDRCAERTAFHIYDEDRHIFELAGTNDEAGGLEDV